VQIMIFNKAIADSYDGEKVFKSNLDFNRELLKRCPNAAVVNPDWIKSESDNAEPYKKIENGTATKDERMDYKVNIETSCVNKLLSEVLIQKIIKAL